MSLFTCFLYASELDDEGCLCLRLNQQGSVDAALEHRSYADIKKLQHSATTLVIVSARHLSFYGVELPWLPEKKARAALPYALEDKLASPVDTLHFAFDKAHYQNGHYLVAVCDKGWLSELMTQLNKYSVDFDAICPDWFALRDKEQALLGTDFLVNDSRYFTGLLPEELTPIYLASLPDDLITYVFDKAEHKGLSGNVQPIDVSPQLWIAQRLQSNKYISLNQGEYQQLGNQVQTRRWYWAAGTMAVLWLISFLVINGLQLRSVNAQLNEVNSEIATLYRQFFPDAKQVISPKFRIGQLLKSHKSTNDSAIWLLLNQLTLAVQDGNTTIEQLKFQGQSMQVTVLSRDFDTLEAMQTALQKARVTVKQLQAASHEKKVMATLELSL